MRSVPKGLCFIIFIAIACFSTLHAQSDSEKHPFEYTGALFGYYQINDETGKYLPPVDQFLERPRRASDGVLLGMGDNFGPEFRASIHPANIETMPNCGLPPHKRDGKVESYPQAIYKLEDRLLSPEKIDCDNVVRFLIKAHYSAIVPGREDFLYSALWLRNTALGLRHLVGAPPRMLAANLRVKWTGEGAHLKYGPINDRDPSRTVSPLLFAGSAYPSNPDSPLFIKPSPPPVSTPLANTSSPSICATQADSTPQALQCMQQRVEESASHLTDLLTADLNKMAELNKEDRSDLKVVLSEQQDTGFAIVGTSFPTLVIGVVGVETMSSVSPGNLKLCSNFVDRNAPANAIKAAPCNTQKPSFGSDTGRLVGMVTAVDPLQTVVAILRGLTVTGATFKRVVIMAQMPRTEAEEMAAQLRKQMILYKIQPDPDNRKTGDSAVAPYPIIILSEAQQDHASPYLDASYDSLDLIPVLTPHPAYNTETKNLYGPISTASVTLSPTGQPNKPHETASISNEPGLEPVVGAFAIRSEEQKTTDGLLLAELWDLASGKPESPAAELFGYPTSSGKNLIPPKCSASPYRDPSKENPDSCRLALSEFLLRRLQITTHADTVFLERRDIFFAPLPNRYDGYEVCDELEPDKVAQRRCKLGVALDRVLWKGDFEQKVMIAGKDITTMLKTSEQQRIDEKNLAARDSSGHWLATFGVVKAQPNTKANSKATPSGSAAGLNAPSTNTGNYPIPFDPNCTIAPSAGSNGPSYCINGTPIVSDAAYLLVTSDQIVADSAIYKVLPIPDYAQPIKKFVTEDIADSLFPHALGRITPASQVAETPVVRVAEDVQQKRPLYHIDFAKVVAGYSGRAPEGGNAYVANNFQGAANSVAATASQSEVDLENQLRVSLDLPIQLSALENLTPRGFRLISVGFQDDVEYDHTTTGNLTGKPVNGIYALNSFTVGGFVQFRLLNVTKRGLVAPLASRSLPRALLILSPHQYQTQINGGYLFFPYSASGCIISTGNPCEYTVHLPKTSSYVDKVGMRLESGGGPWWKVDRGSYAEFGFQRGTQSNVLSAMTLVANGISFTCPATSAIPISLCFSNYGKTNKNFIVDATTQAVFPIPTTTLNLVGGYWDIHAQKGLFKTADKSGPGVSLTVDAKADWFSPKRAGRTLSTAEVYAIPLAAAVNFPILRNLTLSPTYSVFFYQAQLTGAKLQANTFSIAAKWYFAHDTSVPPIKQLPYQGPASSDQTKTSKIK